MTVLGAKNVYASAEQFAVAFGMITLALIIAADWTKKRMIPAAFYMIVLACGVVTILIGYDAMSVFCILALFLVLAVEGVRMLLCKD
jgi:MFS superfamily sulfate permease-like transporter